MSDLYSEILKYENMPLSESQLFTLKENYANMIIDGMDMDDMYQMCFDMLMDAYKDCTEDDIKGEVIELYDEEVLEGLMPGDWHLCYNYFTNSWGQWLTLVNCMMI